MSQSVFASALLNPEAPVPESLTDPFGQPAPKRFSVYRNNVASSLARALEAGFPTLRKLLGDEFFAAMALAFLRDHPPRSRRLTLYGDALPGWLEAFPPVAHLAYLPDVARLDQAMRESYHAADSTPLPEAEFQALLGADLGALRLTLAPSLRLVHSRWPIAAIWTANHHGGAPAKAGGQGAVVLRPEFDPRPYPVTLGAAAFLDGLIAGKTLGESLELASETFDLPGLLGLLIANRAIVGARP